MTNPEKTIHLPGGNRYDDMRIDIAEAHRRLDAVAELPEALRIAGLKRRSLGARIDRVLMHRNLLYPLVVNGLRRAWFEEFRDYWSNGLQGRPLEIFDFLFLRSVYRQRFQSTQTLQWDSPAQHLKNWQVPQNIYTTFGHVLKYALAPIRYERLRNWAKPGVRILEYGCALAPMYRQYRSYLPSSGACWYLADIPGFPFHYSRWTYRNDPDVAALIPIGEQAFQDPLGSVDATFDVIILQEVLEHLDEPLFLIRYLYERLEPDGLLQFDYINSDAIGLDTPSSKEQRTEVLKFIAANFEPVEGIFDISEVSVGTTLVRKKATAAD